MNLDDPKLTAFALEEIHEPERSTIARAIADSVEAQQFVDETRKLAQALKSNFAAALEKQSPGPIAGRLIDIRDDPWFWSIARPLAIAAGIAIFAILGAITIATYKSRTHSSAADVNYADVEAEEKPQVDAPPQFRAPNDIPNPLPSDVIRHVERVVIGELIPESKNGELRVIETINDAYRLQRLKQRLTSSVLSKKWHRNIAGRIYQLMFLDRNGQVVASAGFYRVAGAEFVLRPSQYSYERGGHYFISGNEPLPGDWQSEIDYSEYVMSFPDWAECIGYSPGV